MILIRKVIFRQLLLLLMLLMAANICVAQVREIETKESALRKLKKDNSDSTRQYLYNFLGGIYLYESQYDKRFLDSSFYYLRKAVYEGDSLNHSNKKITNESLCGLAQAYHWIGDVATCTKIYQQVIANYRRSNQKQEEAESWNRMAQGLSSDHIYPERITAYFDSAIALFAQQNEILDESEVMLNKVNFLHAIGNTDLADKQLRVLTTLAKANHFEYFSVIYLMLAHDNRYKGNFNLALEYALDALKFKSLAKNEDGLHNMYGELAQIYDELGEAEQSVFWYQKCIAEREKININRYVIIRTMSMMVVQMIKLGKGKEALGLLQQLARKNPPVTHAEKGALAQSFAYCYKSMNQTKLAEQKFMEMITEYNEGESQQEMLQIANYDVASFFVSTNQFARAEPYLKKAELNIISAQQIKEIFFLKFKADSASGNFVSAIQYFQKYKAVNDSIFNETKSRQINELMIRYDPQKKITVSKRSKPKQVCKTAGF